MRKSVVTMTIISMVDFTISEIKIKQCNEDQDNLLQQNTDNFKLTLK